MLKIALHIPNMMMEIKKIHMDIPMPMVAVMAALKRPDNKSALNLLEKSPLMEIKTLPSIIPPVRHISSKDRLHILSLNVRVINRGVK